MIILETIKPIIETIKPHATLIGLTDCLVVWIMGSPDFALIAGVIIAVLTIAVKVLQLIEQVKKTNKKKKRKKK